MLTKALRRDLCVIGDLQEKNIAGIRRMRTGHALARKGYVTRVRDGRRVRFQLTELGELRYRAELSHLRHCMGCTTCNAVARHGR